MTRVVADSHAIHWYVQGSDRLSDDAASALASAEAGGGIVVSVATIVDLWYVTQTTEGVTPYDLEGNLERSGRDRRLRCRCHNSAFSDFSRLAALVQTIW